MDKVSSKNLVLWVIGFFILILAVIGFTYAFFAYTRTSSTGSKIETGNAMLGYVGETNGISLTNAMPISDDVALNTKNEDEYFDFYVTYNFGANAVLSYEINIENTTSNLDEVQAGTLTSLDTSRIKIALEDRTVTLPDEPLVVSPTYFSALETVDASNDKSGYYLYSKTTSGESVDYYRLYMWIPEVDDTGVAIPLIDNEGVAGIRNQAFSVKINVQALAQAID